MLVRGREGHEAATEHGPPSNLCIGGGRSCERYKTGPFTECIGDVAELGPRTTAESLNYGPWGPRAFLGRYFHCIFFITYYIAAVSMLSTRCQHRTTPLQQPRSAG